MCKPTYLSRLSSKYDGNENKHIVHIVIFVQSNFNGPDFLSKYTIFE